MGEEVGEGVAEREDGGKAVCPPHGGVDGATFLGKDVAVDHEEVEAVHEGRECQQIRHGDQIRQLGVRIGRQRMGGLHPSKANGDDYQQDGDDDHLGVVHNLWQHRLQQWVASDVFTEWIETHRNKRVGAEHFELPGLKKFLADAYIRHVVEVGDEHEHGRRFYDPGCNE